jgi:hypothetical protein
VTARIAWAALAATAGAIAAVAIWQWADALVSGRPVLYGEGAVAHAALLLRGPLADPTGPIAVLRGGGPYADTTGAVAANYPPLYLAIASLGDPFRVGRGVTIASAFAVGAIVWWRAGGAPALVRGALALGWIALAPVAIWGAAVKPDLLAVALTVGGVAVLERAMARRDAGALAFAGGALLAAAVWAKPTALLPAVALLAFVAIRARHALPRAAAGAALVAGFALAHAATLDLAAVWRHVVVWNALPWSGEQEILVVVLAAATVGILTAAAALVRALRGLALAYALGALGVVLLGGREGATINYLLDLAAATSFAVAAVAPRIAASPAYPAAAIVQLVIAVGLLAPFGVVPGREPTTGAWGARERMGLARELGRGGAHLVEDSGLLVAAGIEPVVDDLFLWSRLAERGLIDPAPLIERVRRGELATVVSETDLAALHTAPAYERARWHPALVAAILERYELAADVGSARDAGARRILFVYRPR